MENLVDPKNATSDKKRIAENLYSIFVVTPKNPFGSTVYTDKSNFERLNKCQVFKAWPTVGEVPEIPLAEESKKKTMKDIKLSADLYQIVVEGRTEYTNKNNFLAKQAGAYFSSYARIADVPKSGDSLEEIDKGAKYKKTIRDRDTGETIKGDVYDVLEAFGIACPARQHAVKKLLMPGQRGSKGYDKDCNEAINSVEQSKLLQKYRK